jgi:cell division protein ZapA (FtsZ GTPase activity inhibitor)
LFKNKLSVTTNVGTQRNNLDDDQLNTLRRGVGSINVNVMPHPKLNINVAYSGFQSFSQIRTRFDQLNQLTPLDRYRDSLKFTQISQNASLNINYELARSRNSQQYLNINGSYQIADNQQSVGNIQSDISRFYNSNVSYSLSIRPLGFNAVVAFDFNQNVAQNLSNRILGPTLMLKKLMLEQKLLSSLTLSQNNSYTDGRLSDSIFNIRWSNGYNVARQHMLSLNAIWLTRTRYEQTTQAAQKASEFTLTFKYTFIL